MNEVFEGLSLDEDIAQFAKGLVAFGGEGITDTKGGISFTLGIGLEYVKNAKTKILPYIKGTTGLDLYFSIESNANFLASIGPFTADVDVSVVVDDYGDDLSIQFGLEDSLNYYLSSNKSLARDGFAVVANPIGLVDELDASISGRVEGQVDATFVVPGGFGEVRRNGNLMRDRSPWWTYLYIHELICPLFIFI